MPDYLVKLARCKTALVRTRIPNYSFCLNPYSGCAHDCPYCYAARPRRFSNPGENKEKFLTVKENLVDVLRNELKRRRAPLGGVLVGTVTDAYQPLEKDFGLTRDSLQAFLDEYPEAELDILTKSNLVLRDAELIKKLKGCTVGFTVTTVDDEVASVLEPGASSPSARLQAARRLIQQGIPVWVFIAPVLPGVTDAPGALESLLSALKGAKIKEVYLDPLNPYPTCVERLKSTYRRHIRQALPKLEHYLSDRPGYLNVLTQRLRLLSREYGYSLRI